MGAGPWWMAWAVYGPMALLGAAWAYLSRGTIWSTAHTPWLSSQRGTAAVAGLIASLVLAIATVALTRVLVAHARWARDLHLTLRAALAGTSAQRVLQLALLSALSEELLFRAALLPMLGIAASSLLFGLVHISPRGSYFAWAAWASVMGALFGLLYEASGTLLAPVLAHALINYENMQYIIHYDPTPLDMDRLR